MLSELIFNSFSFFLLHQINYISEFESKLMSSPIENPGSKSPDSHHDFDKSLQELKDLRSQLHHAADHCEITYLKTKEKKQVMENTKEYICRAMISVVDHLGTVSSNLDRKISESNVVSESELRMHLLKLRFLTCQQYTQSLVLSKVRLTNNSPSHLPHYVTKENTYLPEPKDLREEIVDSQASKTAPFAEKTNLRKPKDHREEIVDSQASKTTPKYKSSRVIERMSLPLYGNSHKPLLALYNYGFKKLGIQSASGFRVLSKILPAREVMPIPPVYRNPSFDFQAETKMHDDNKHKRRSLQITRSNSTRAM